ncbi:hypothetical protein B0H17DRAFT_1036723 [Mycena rosella]|uniref:rRNA-processing protein n=1 Tax=Mycena rosella TaxID=1033263 RepID=A0AAD7GVV2_MYCRO|nr:hypothetical protein B0H17DRAFT_1036723 [Mycena rosella]
MENPVALAPSASGRVSGKNWKQQKTATVRSHLQDGVKTKSWEDRVAQTKKAHAIKKLQTELKDEKQAEKSPRPAKRLQRSAAASRRTS